MCVWGGGGSGENVSIISDSCMQYTCTCRGLQVGKMELALRTCHIMMSIVG